MGSRVVACYICIPIYPCVGSTSRLRICSCTAGKDGQIQGYYRITTCCIDECMGSCIVAGRVGIPIYPGVASTRGMGNCTPIAAGNISV